MSATSSEYFCPLTYFFLLVSPPICIFRTGPDLICAFTPASALLTIKTTHMRRQELACSPGEEISRSRTTKVNNILRPAAALQRDAAENKITTFSSQGRFCSSMEDSICLELLFSKLLTKPSMSCGRWIWWKCKVLVASRRSVRL